MVLVVSSSPSSQMNALTPDKLPDKGLCCREVENEELGFQLLPHCEITRAWYLQFLNCFRVLWATRKSPWSALLVPDFREEGSCWWTFIVVWNHYKFLNSIALPFPGSLIHYRTSLSLLGLEVSSLVLTVFNTPDKNSNISLFSLISPTGHCLLKTHFTVQQYSEAYTSLFQTNKAIRFNF